MSNVIILTGGYNLERMGASALRAFGMARLFEGLGTRFPIKFVEAPTFGVPVITNAARDIPIYLRDGENGVLAPDISSEQIVGALRRAIEMMPAALATMSKTCNGENPFEMLLWVESTLNFLKT